MYSVQAQSSTLGVPNDLQFVPTKLSLENKHILPTANYFTSSNKLLFSTGWILQGLKYDSIVDDFSSLAPFDSRDFEPKSITELNLLITSNYLLIDN